MKDMSEFKKSVYEKAEKAEETRRQRIKTVTKISSVAAAIAIVFISVFAVIRPGFSYGKKANEATSNDVRFASNIYAVINENGEVENFVELDEYGAVNYIDVTDLNRNGGIGVSAYNSDSSPEKTSGKVTYSLNEADNNVRLDYGNVRYSCNIITQGELEELIKNSTGASTSSAASHITEGVEETLPAVIATTTPAWTKIEQTDFSTLVVETCPGEINTTTTAATNKNAASTTTTQAGATPPGDTAEAELPSVIYAAFGDGAERSSSYVVAYSAADFTRWLQVSKIELSSDELGEKDRFLSEFVYANCSGDFKPFVAFIATNEKRQNDIAITKFESKDGTLTLLYRFEGDENTVDDGETFMIFAFLPEGTTNIVFEKESI